MCNITFKDSVTNLVNLLMSLVTVSTVVGCDTASVGHITSTTLANASVILHVLILLLDLFSIQTTNTPVIAVKLNNATSLTKGGNYDETALDASIVRSEFGVDDIVLEVIDRTITSVIDRMTLAGSLVVAISLHRVRRTNCGGSTRALGISVRSARIVANLNSLIGVREDSPVIHGRSEGGRLRRRRSLSWGQSDGRWVLVVVVALARDKSSSSNEYLASSCG
jgi:hypothetical protein